MKKKCDSTIDEAVEAQFRIAELMGTLWEVKWMGLIFAPVVFIAIFIILDDLAGKLIMGGTAAGLFVPYHLSTYKKNYQKRIRKALVKVLGTDQPIPCEYEIDETGLAFRKLGQELKFSWGNIKRINHTDESIEVIMEPIGIAIIPKRIFGDPAELQQWIAFIDNHKGSNKPIQATPNGAPDS